MSNTINNLHDCCRKAACVAFDKALPQGVMLMNEMETYLGVLFERLRKVSLTGNQNSHRVPLIVSYIRTHMVIDELIRYCENIEAATLIRKQLELLARYKETENMEELAKLIGCPVCRTKNALD